MRNKIYDMNEHDLIQELIGKVVTGINPDESTLALSDGTVLTFEDTQECCAWFCAELEAGNLTENAVTAIRYADNAPNADAYGDENYTLHILAVDHSIADLTITGNPGTGYYCRSIDLKITEPRND